MIHPTAKVSEEVNRQCPARNTTVQKYDWYEHTAFTTLWLAVHHTHVLRRK